jgi:hypothetical protein
VSSSHTPIYASPMASTDSPLAPHAASPAELRDRIAAERAGLPFLVLRDGEGAQRIVTLPQGAARVASIGRSTGNTVALPWDTEVSRLHAELERLGDEWTVSDDGLSRNGTFVNGQRISGRHRLRDGDVLRAGRTTIAYVVPEAPDSRPTQVAGGGGAAPSVSPAQRAVLVALARPLKDAAAATPATNQTIAAELFLSVDAVKAHLRAMFALFGLGDLPQNEKRSVLAARALQEGIVTRRDL